MKLVLVIFVSFLLFTTCKTHLPAEASTPSDPQTNAGSCRIEGTIVEVLAPDSQDTNDVCFKNSCDAIIHVERINHCGSSASVIPDERGEIKVHFPNSLKPAGTESQSAGPKKALIRGSVFSASVETRLAPGDKINYVIYIFEIK